MVSLVTPWTCVQSQKSKKKTQLHTVQVLQFLLQDYHSYGIHHKKILHRVSGMSDSGCRDCKVLKEKLVILGYINKLDLRLPEDNIAWCRHPALGHRTGGSLERHTNTRWHTLSTTCLRVQKLYFINPPGEIHPLHLTRFNYLWAAGSHSAALLLWNTLIKGSGRKHSP